MHEASGTITAKEVLDHQEAFAAGYADDEYALLGMAVTYTKLHGQRITIAGNPDTSVFLFSTLDSIPQTARLCGRSSNDAEPSGEFKDENLTRARVPRD